MSKLLSKLLASGTKKVTTLDESEVFIERDIITTNIPIIDAAFSGKLLGGGFTTGVSMLAGESRTYKTLFALRCLRAYLRKYPDAVAIYYDSEHGSTPEYVEANGIDTTRVIHIPVKTIEEVKFDLVQRMDKVERGERVFVLLDSLGSLASTLEMSNAMDENTAADLKRSQAVRSFFRVTFPHFVEKNLPFFIINHSYKTLEKFAKNVVGGGTAATYWPNNSFIFTRAQEKEGEELVGYRFTINVEKSRFVKEKSKFPFVVTYEHGLNSFSGLFDLALESGHIEESKKGWYVVKGTEDKFRRNATNTKEFWKPLLQDKTFLEWVEKQYVLGLDTPLSDDIIAEEFEI